ncbi:glycosyltransferase family 4 protein [Emcibacteraceae bacterium]|nr:glycosyltransferase family 4 protein [Emcibacteraceae bacterium]
MKKKTFWYINDYAGSKHHGMVFRDYYIAKELLKKGHKVYIISAAFSHLFKTPPEIRGHYTHELIDGIEYIWVKVPHYKNSTDKKRVLKWLVFLMKVFWMPKKDLSNPDYIIAGQLNPFLILTVQWLAQKYNAVLACDVRDLWPLTLCDVGGYSPKHPFIRVMQWFSDYAYRNADMITSSLPNAYEYLKTRGLKKEKFQFIPNGISIEDMTNNKPLSKKTLKQIPKNKFIIGYTGGMGIAKCLDSFLNAAVYLKGYSDIEFILVGEGRFEKELKRMKKDLNLNNVRFISAVPKDEVQSVVNLFDVCFIATKKRELYKYGVSQNKLFDYLYAAKPILYAINDHNSVIDQTNCGITVDSSDPKDIARGAIALYGLSIKERVEMGERGKKLISLQHNYKHSAEKLINALENI